MLLALVLDVALLDLLLLDSLLLDLLTDGRFVDLLPGDGVSVDLLLLLQVTIDARSLYRGRVSGLATLWFFRAVLGVDQRGRPLILRRHRRR